MTETALTEFVSGRMSVEALRDFDAHVDGCGACFQMVAVVARTTMGEGKLPSFVAEPAASGPRQIDEYCLLRRLGQGAMGQVFLALDTRLDRQVAIKMLGAGLRAEARERFLIEARAIARLSHPNVVAIHRVADLGEQPYLVQEFVRGTSLAELEKPLPWPRALELGLGLTRGLAAAHRAGVLHRDLKPANAMLSVEGSIKLLDFGLAKLSDSSAPATRHEPLSLEDGLVARAGTSSPSLTSTGALMGTPLYMAPEAWRGEAPSVAMDLYSLGAVLRELCTGVPVHQGRTLGQLERAVREDPVAPLASLVPGIQARFAQAVDRCLRRDPGERFVSADALLAELEAAERESRRAPRRLWPMLVVAAVLVAVLVAVLATVAAVAARHAPAGRRHAGSTAPEVCTSTGWCWDPRVPAALGASWTRSRDDAWAVGNSGTILHWDGRAWTRSPSGTLALLTSVSGTAPDDVWAVGQGGAILHWDGRSWQSLQVRTKSLLFSVVAIARDDAWLVGDDATALHWDGKTWSPVPLPVTSTLNLLAARASDDVWAVGDGGVVLRWNGSVWTRIDVGARYRLSRVAIAGPDDVWVGGVDGFVRHLVGGRWQDVELPMTAEHRKRFFICGLWANGPDDVWLVSQREPLLHWDGHSWSYSDPGSPRNMWGLSGSAPDDLWAVNAENLLVHYDGHAWAAPQPPPPYRVYTGAWAAAEDDAWAVGFESTAEDNQPRWALVQHFDGTTWTPLHVPGLARLRAVWGAASDDVWMAGAQGTLAHWDGHALRPVASGVEVDLSGLAGASADDVWAVGQHGALLHGVHGTWTPVASGSENDLRGVWVSGEGEAWAVGAKGTILHHDGEDAPWRAVESGRQEAFYGVWGSGASDVWAVGERGMTLHWDGRSWASVRSDTIHELHAISGSGSDDVWAVGYSWPDNQGTISHWDGHAWALDSHTPMDPLWTVAAAPSGDVWVAGWNEALLHRATRAP